MPSAGFLVIHSCETQNSKNRRSRARYLRMVLGFLPAICVLASVMLAGVGSLSVSQPAVLMNHLTTRLRCFVSLSL